MKTIYLIRHSAPFVEIENYSDRNSVLWDEYNRNMILSPLGEENAKKLCDVKELKDIKEIYASNSPRAIQTAKYLAENNNLKIRLDDRINEREFGIKYLSELPKDYNKESFDNKDLKLDGGESLNDVDSRFNSFITDILNNDSDKVAIIMHGIILLSYLQTICTEFSFDGRNFSIKYNDNIILNGSPKNPSIYKIEYDNNNQVINVDYVECD